MFSNSVTNEKPGKTKGFPNPGWIKGKTGVLFWISFLFKLPMEKTSRRRGKNQSILGHSFFRLLLLVKKKAESEKADFCGKNIPDIIRNVFALSAPKSRHFSNSLQMPLKGVLARF